MRLVGDYATIASQACMHCEREHASPTAHAISYWQDFETSIPVWFTESVLFSCWPWQTGPIINHTVARMSNTAISSLLLADSIVYQPEPAGL